MAEELNRLTAHVGFEIDNKTSSLETIVAQIVKINTTSKNLAKAFSGFEEAFNKLGTISGQSSNKLIADANKTKVQLNEEAKQVTANAKAESNKRIVFDKAEADSRVLHVKRQNDIVNANHKKSLEKLITDNKLAMLSITEEEKRKTLTVNAELKKELIDYKANNDRKKQLAKEYTSFWTTELNKQESFSKEHYQSLVAQAKSAYSQMSSSVNSLNAITNKNTTLGNQDTRNQFGYAVANATLTVTGVRAVLNEFANVSREVIEVEKNAINIQRIMKDTSTDTLDNLTKYAIETAKSTATNVTDVQDIQSSWVRINDVYADNIGLLNQITEATAKFVNVGEIADAEEAVTLLNASMLQFGMVTQDASGKTQVDINEALKTLDKWAYMADKTALGTADEFGKSVSKVGGFLTTLGADMDDAIVLTSILGDRLAKTGDEAGNSLKTISAYLTRDKTLNLFNQLGLDSEGLSQSLMKTSTKFEEFEVIMDKVSGAYNDAIASGNDINAKAIQNAIGATRQGDSAIALLKNWAEDSVKYYGMIEKVSDTPYLDEQNVELMKSFEAQWKALKASMVEFGSSIAKSGLIDGLSSVMGGFGDLLHYLSQLDESALKFMTTFIVLSVALGGIKKISKLAGIYDVFTTAVNYGSVAQRQQAEALANTTKMVLQNELATLSAKRATDAYIGASVEDKLAIDNSVKAYTLKNIQLEVLTSQYAKGTITAEQYTASVAGLGVVEKAENLTTEEGIVLDNASNVSKTVSATTTKTLTVATTAQAIAGRVLNGVTATGTAILKSFLNPVFLITTAVTVLISVFSMLKNKLKEQNEAIETAKQEYSDLKAEITEVSDEIKNTQKRIDELNAKGTLISIVEEDELTKLKDTNAELKTRNDILKEQALILQQDIADGVKSKYDEKVNTKYDSITRINVYSARGMKIYDPEIVKYEEHIKELESEFKRLSEISPELISDEDSTKLKSYREELVAIAKEYYDRVDEYGIDDEISQGWTAISEGIGNVIYSIEGANSAIEQFKDEASEEDLNIFGTSEESLDSFQASIGKIKSALADLDMDSTSLIDLMQDFSDFDWKKYGVTGQKGVGNLEDALKALSYEVLQNARPALQDFGGAIDSIFSSLYDGGVDIDGLITKLDNLNAVLIRVKNGEKLSAIEIANLIKENKELASAVVVTADGYSIEEEALTSLINKQSEDATVSISAQIDKTNSIINQTRSRIDAYIIEAKALNALADSYSTYATDIESYVGHYGYTSAVGEFGQEAIDKYYNNVSDKAMNEASINKLADLQNKLGITSTYNSDTRKETKEKKEEDPHLDEFNAKLDTLKHDLTMEKITEEQYYNSLETLYKDYLSNKKKYLKEYRQYEEEVYTGRKKIEESKFKNSIDFGANSLDNLKSKVDDAQNVYNNSKGYDEQVKAIKKLNIAQDNLLNGYQKYYDMIKGQYDDIKGIDSYKKQIESGKIFEVSEFTDEKIFEKVQTAQGLFQDLDGTFSDIESTTQDIKENYDDINDTIEDIFGEIDSLQSDIVDALKEQYQDMYDDRVKLLKKETKADVDASNERIKLLQAEIDKINGNTPEDKYNKRALLQNQYNDWTNDNSTLGKSKQKEYLDQIAELNKEISIDTIEAEIKKEQDNIDDINKNLEDLLDETSDFFDKDLKELKDKMTTQNLNDEAMELMIDGNEKQIIALLSKYNESIHGTIAKTMGQIIGDKVKSAIEGLKIVINGGYGSIVSTTSPASSAVSGALVGIHGASAVNTPTNTASNIATTVSKSISTALSTAIKSPTSTKSTATATKDKTTTVAKGDTLWELAEEYYGDGSKWTKIAKENNISDASTLQVGKKLIIPFMTGGYTGDNEGLAYLHEKERVLNKHQTNAFDTLIYDFIPKMSNDLTGNKVSGSVVNNNSTTFNKELVSVNIEKMVNNTPYDIKNEHDNLDRMFTKSLHKSGANIKL